MGNFPSDFEESLLTKHMQSRDTHFFNKVRTMLVTATEPAEGSISAFPGALFAAQ